MKNFYFLLSLILGIFFSQKTIAQEYTCTASSVSEDNTLLITSHYKTALLENPNIIAENQIRIFHLPTGRMIRKFNISQMKAVELVNFTADRKSVIIKGGERLLIYDIRNPRQIKEIKGRFLLMKQNKEVLLCQGNNVLKLINIQDNKTIRTFDGIVSQRIISEMVESEDQQYLIVKTYLQADKKEKIESKSNVSKNSERIFIWDVEQQKTICQLKCKDVAMSKNCRELTVLNIKGNKNVIEKYDFPSFELKNEFDSESLTDSLDYAVFLPSQSKISLQGRYALLSVLQPKIQRAYILDLQNKKIVHRISERKLPLLYFIGDSMLCTYKNAQQKQYFNLKTKKKHESKDSTFIFQNADKQYFIEKKLEDQIPNLEISWNDLTEKKIKKDSLLFLNVSPNKEIIIAEKYLPNTFLDTSRYLPKPIQIVYFKTKNLDNQDSTAFFLATEVYKSRPEEVIDEDMKASLKNIFLDTLLPFQEISKTQNILLNPQNIEFGQQKISLELHLLDSLGNYFQGAKESDWKKMICEWYLVKDNTQISLPKFKMKEFAEKDSLPFSMALVMDHSGSMGRERAKIVQESAEEFVKTKLKKDAIALIKYDQNIGIESVLEDDPKLILQNFKKDALNGYGGATALLDAIGEAVDVLSESPIDKPRVIIAFTDGYENASFFGLDQIVQKAIKNEVKIITIGFGNMIDVRFLQELAQATQGSYYHIFETEDFYKIFKDVNRKMRNHYEIEFSTQDLKINHIKDYRLQWKICEDFQQKIAKDSLKITHSQNQNFKDKYSDLAEEPKIGDLKLLNVEFVFNKTKIVSSSEQEIERAVDFLKKYPKIKIELRGHTDNVGSEMANLELSKERAQKIKEEMVARGIESKRIKTRGFGENMPIADNGTYIGRARNRRTEMLILEK